MLAALRNRRFTAYLFAAGSADAGFWVSLIAQGWLVVRLTNSPFWLGTVAAVSQLPFLLFSLAGGDLADRFPRRLVIAANNIAMIAIAVGTALAIATGTITVWWLAVLGFLAGTINALEHPVDRAWVVDLIRGRDLGTSIALSSLEWSVARTAGPALGGLIVAVAGVAFGYAAYALMVVPIIVLALVSRTTNAKDDDATHDARSADARMREIVAFCIFIGAFTAGVTPYIAFLPDIAKNTFHLDARGYGAMAAAGGIGAIAGGVGLSLIGEVQRKGRVVAVTALAGALLLAAFALTHAIELAIVLLAAMGAVDTLMYALANTYVQQLSGNAARGRANAIFSLAFLGGIPVGSAILGVASGRFGTAPTLAISALAVAVAAVVFWFGAPVARDAA